MMDLVYEDNLYDSNGVYVKTIREEFEASEGDVIEFLVSLQTKYDPRDKEQMNAMRHLAERLYEDYEDEINDMLAKDEDFIRFAYTRYCKEVDR